MKILLCAATVFEAGACQKAVRQAKASAKVSVLKTGMGGEAAASALTRALESAIASGVQPERVISTGFAGSRRALLKMGDVITVRKVSSEGKSIPIVPAAIRSIPFREVSLEQVSKIMGAAGEDETGEVEAVDMESYSLAEVAARFQIPFSVIRIVSDDPEHPIPDGGWLEMVSSPLRLARFIARSSSLPTKLRRLWEQLLTNEFRS